MGRHEKAPVRCTCSQLAALHGAPQTLHGCSRGCGVVILSAYDLLVMEEMA